MLVLNNLNIKNNKQKDWVICDINLKFEPKKVYAIIGRSGSGKTTLMNSICFGTKFNNGTIFFNNEKINKKNLKKFRKKISIISSNTLINELTVYENIKNILSIENNLFFSLFNIVKKDQKKIIFDLLSQLKIENKIFEKVSNLSVGENQKVTIALGLLKKSKIVLADEPTSNLDQLNSENVIDLFKKTAIEKNQIFIVNTHNLLLLENKNIDYLIGIKNKKIVFFKKNSQVNLDLLKKIYENND